MTMVRRHLLSAVMLGTLCACNNASSDPAAPPPERDLAADEGPNGAMTYYGKKIEVDCGDVAIPPRPDGRRRGLSCFLQRHGGNVGHATVRGCLQRPQQFEELVGLGRAGRPAGAS